MKSKWGKEKKWPWWRQRNQRKNPGRLDWRHCSLAIMFSIWKGKTEIIATTTTPSAAWIQCTKWKNTLNWEIYFVPKCIMHALIKLLRVEWMRMLNKIRKKCSYSTTQTGFSFLHVIGYYKYECKNVVCTIKIKSLKSNRIELTRAEINWNGHEW